MAEPIPESWLNHIVRILRTSDKDKIDWTPQALQCWKADTCGAWNYEAYEAMIAALSIQGVEGNETTSQQGQLATYEFLFWRGNTRMYGKIALRKDQERILILSAHRAKRATL